MGYILSGELEQHTSLFKEIPKRWLLFLSNAINKDLIEKSSLRRIYSNFWKLDWNKSRLKEGLLNYRRFGVFKLKSKQVASAHECEGCVHKIPHTGELWISFHNSTQQYLYCCSCPKSKDRWGLFANYYRTLCKWLVCGTNFTFFMSKNSCIFPVQCFMLSPELIQYQPVRIMVNRHFSKNGYSTTHILTQRIHLRIYDMNFERILIFIHNNLRTPCKLYRYGKSPYFTGISIIHCNLI